MVRFGIRTLFVAVLIVAIGCLVYTQVLLPVRESAQSTSCKYNMRQIAIALINYESAHGCLPFGVETSPDGNLWRSWRTNVYPIYMEQSPAVYDSTTAWDSPNNMRLLNGTPIPFSGKGGRNLGMIAMDPSPSTLCCPSDNKRTPTGINYVVITGELTAFPKSRRVRLADISDGLENTILVVESRTCTPKWTEPSDLEFDTMSFEINSSSAPGISSNHPSGGWVAFADGNAYFLTDKVTELELTALLTISGNENVTRSDLLARGVLLDK